MGCRSRSAWGVAIAVAVAPASVQAQVLNNDTCAVELDGQLGWTQGQHSGGVTIGSTARARYRVLTAGGALQLATTILGSTGSVSALAGLSVPLGYVRLDALGEIGGNAYTAVGSNFMTDDPGTSEALAFAGGRLALLGRVHEGARGRSIWLGVTASYAKDLETVRRTYSYRSEGTDWISGEQYDRLESSTVEIGQSRWAVLATTAVSLPF